MNQYELGDFIDETVPLDELAKNYPQLVKAWELLKEAHYLHSDVEDIETTSDLEEKRVNRIFEKAWERYLRRNKTFDLELKSYNTDVENHDRFGDIWLA